MHAYIYVCNNSLLYLKAKYISIIKPSGLNKFSKKKNSNCHSHLHLHGFQKCNPLHLVVRLGSWLIWRGRVSIDKVVGGVLCR